MKPVEKPVLEGFGDLWADIQNLQEKDPKNNDPGIAVGSKETEESKENSKMERKEESSDSEISEDDDEEEDSTEDEDEEEEEEEEEYEDWRSPDLRLLKVEDRRWRSETTGSSSSAEPTMSSFTNGTHSSLNSEVEEEELACSIEPGVENNSYSHFKGHLSDHSNDIREKTCRATDSDNEEFCDSMEHLAMQEGSGTSKVQSSGSKAASVRRKEHGVLIGGTHVEEGIGTAQNNSSLSRRGRVSQSPRAACGSQMCVNVSQSRHSTSAAGGNINEQIATVLLRLQDDMTHVLHRLHALEVLTVSQSRSPSPRQEDSLALTRQRPSWWPFHLSPVTVVLTTVWPLIVHWLVHIYFQRKTKKIS